MDITEGVYAYLYKNNYAGPTDVMEGLYTVTDGASEQDIAVALEAARAHGSPALENIDGKLGVTDGEVKPDYKLAAYSYVPEACGTKAVLARTTLRASLRRKKNLRGNKQLLHFVITDIRDGDYAADYLFGGALDDYDDIPLDEENEGDGYVTELVPERLKAFDEKRFTSEPIGKAALKKAGGSNIAALVAELFAARAAGKPLYITCPTEKVELVRKRLGFALKTMPAQLSNRISFITCCDGNVGVKRDICCVPTSDAALISRLSERGRVLTVKEDGSIDADYSACGLARLAAEFENSDAATFDFPYYIADYVKSFDELEALASLFADKNSDKICTRAAEAFALVFRSEDNDKAYAFLFDKLLTADNERMINAFCEFIASGGRTDECIEYCFARTDGKDVYAAVAEMLLYSLFPPLEQKTLPALFEFYEKLEGLPPAPEPVRDRAFAIFSERITESGDEIINSASLEALDNADALRIKKIAAAFSARQDKADADFAAGLNDIAERYAELADAESDEKRLFEMRERFVLRELSLLDGKTAHSVLVKCLGKERVAAEYKSHGLGRAQTKSDKYMSVAEEIVKERFADGNEPQYVKTSLCAEIKRERDKRNVGLSRLVWASQRLVQSILLTAVVFVISAALSFVFYRFLADGAMPVIHAALPVATAAFSQLLFWTDLAQKRYRDPALRAAIHSAVAVIAVFGFYAAVYAVLTIGG